MNDDPEAPPTTTSTAHHHDERHPLRACLMTVARLPGTLTATIPGSSPSPSPSPSASEAVRADSPAADTAGVRRQRQERTASLLARAAACAGLRDRQRLQQEVVVLNLAFADGIASRYRGRGVDWDDLVQVGRVGLVKAVIGYIAGKGTDFAAYATPTIAGEIKRHFRDYGWAIRPPRRSQELRSELQRVESALWQRLHRTPGNDELALALGVSEPQLGEVRLLSGCYSAFSLDAPFGRDGPTALGDLLPDQRDDFASVDRAESLRPALALLTDRERQIVRLRFVRSYTQEEIGQALGVSQMQVSRLLAGILARLRANLTDSDEARPEL